MERHLGTNFEFRDMATGEIKQFRTENGMTWFTKGLAPEVEVDEETGEVEKTGKMEEVDHGVAYEVMISKHRPIDAKGKAFTRWAMLKIAEELDAKSEAIKLYCHSLER